MTIDKKLKEAQRGAWVVACGIYPKIKYTVTTAAWSAWSSVESARSTAWSAGFLRLEERKKQVKMIKEML